MTVCLYRVKVKGKGVFEAVTSIALQQWFSGVVVKGQFKKAIIKFRQLFFPFLLRHNWHAVNGTSQV